MVASACRVSAGDAYGCADVEVASVFERGFLLYFTVLLPVGGRLDDSQCTLSGPVALSTLLLVVQRLTLCWR